jgi:ABC-type multidrug transport system ATPase subunit
MRSSLGGSGSGKTTLLNQIAHRGAGLPVEQGEVAYHSTHAEPLQAGQVPVRTEGDKGGVKMGKKEVKKRIGFVRQQDFLVEHLTGEFDWASS